MPHQDDHKHHPSDALRACDSALLIYDGDCPVCCAARDWVLRHSRSGVIKPVRCQSAERAVLAPHIDEAVCMEAMHLVLPDGRSYAGDTAVRQLLPLLKPGWSWLRFGFYLPGSGLVTPHIYRYIARHRYNLAALFQDVDARPA